MLCQIFPSVVTMVDLDSNDGVEQPVNCLVSDSDLKMSEKFN